MLPRRIYEHLYDKISKENYFESFNSNDIRLRGGLTLEIFLKGCRLPTEEEYIILKRVSDHKYYIIFNKKLENGFPHTHYNYIFLPSNVFTVWGSGKSLKRLLKHESLHIYQRFNPCEFNKYLEKVKGYKIYGLTGNDESRSNPDINFLLYKDSRGVLIDNRYKNADVSNINEINDKRDHPYEVYAYANED